MTKGIITRASAVAIIAALSVSVAWANGYRAKNATVQVAKSGMKVTPARDWNSLSIRPGKKAEIWTLDGEQLNDVTFYGGIAPGEPLIREQSKKQKPLPKFTRETLLVELPELLEGTYRTEKGIGAAPGASKALLLNVCSELTVAPKPPRTPAASATAV